MKIEIEEVAFENIDDLVGPGCIPRWGRSTSCSNLERRRLEEEGVGEKSSSKVWLLRQNCVSGRQTAGFTELYPMQVFPILPKRQKRTVLITCVVVREKTLQSHGICSKLVQSLVKDLKSRRLPFFSDGSAEETAVGS